MFRIVPEFRQERGVCTRRHIAEMRFRRCIILLVILAPRGSLAEPPVSFKNDIAPILVKQCLDCHNAKKVKGGYRLDTFAHLLETGDSDHAPVAAGKPKESELFDLISTEDDDNRMPKKADRLPEAQIALIRRWIEQGAAFDGPAPDAPLASLIAPREYPAAPEVYRRPVAIAAIAFRPDGDELAVGGYHEITLWDPMTGTLTDRIKKLPERIHGLSYSPDGRLLAAACGEPGALGEVRLCNMVGRTPGKAIDQVKDAMLSVRFSPDGTRLAAGGADGSIRLYAIPGGKRESLIEQHGDWVTDLAFNSDGSRLASASRDKSARVIDVKTGATLSAFLGHEEALYGIAWAPDGKALFTSGHDRRVRRWKASDGTKPMDVGGFEGDPFKIESGLGFLFVTCADGILRQYTLDDLDMQRAYPRAADWIYCVAIDPKHRRVATGSHDGTIQVWDVQSGKLLSEFIAAPGITGKRQIAEQRALIDAAIELARQDYTPNELRFLGNPLTDAGVAILLDPTANLPSLHSLDLYRSEITDAALEKMTASGSLLQSLTSLNLGGTKTLTEAGLAKLARPDTGLTSLVVLGLDDTEVTDAVVEQLSRADAGLKRLKRLGLDGTKVTDDGLKILARADTGLKAITSLELRRTEVRDAGLAALARPDTGLKSLTELYLDHAAIYDDGLKALARPDSGLKALRLLDLSRTGITDAGLIEATRPDSGLSHLTTLDLTGTHVTDAGLRTLARPESGMKSLTSLQLFGLHLTDAGLKAMARPGSALKSLTELNIPSPWITDAGLRALARPDTGLSGLRTLNLDGSQLTDAGLMELGRPDCGLKSLTRLVAWGTDVTPAGIEALQNVRPGLQVIK